MSISSLQTLILILVVFGFIGAMRGPFKEIWTLGGLTLTALLLLIGGQAFFMQLPNHLLSGAQSLLGDQKGSNVTATHPMGAPETYLTLWICILSLTALSYYIGNRIGHKTPSKQTNNNFIPGFVIGSLNGLLISAFVFSQAGLNNMKIQFPDADLTRSATVPLILLGFAAAIIAIIWMGRGEKSAAK